MKNVKILVQDLVDLMHSVMLLNTHQYVHVKMVILVIRFHHVNLDQVRNNNKMYFSEYYIYV